MLFDVNITGVMRGLGYARDVALSVSRDVRRRGLRCAAQETAQCVTCEALKLVETLRGAWLALVSGLTEAERLIEAEVLAQTPEEKPPPVVAPPSLFREGGGAAWGNATAVPPTGRAFAACLCVSSCQRSSADLRRVRKNAVSRQLRRGGGAVVVRAGVRAVLYATERRRAGRVALRLCLRHAGGL